MAYYIGCDLGGTNMRAAVLNSESGELLGMQSVPTRAEEGHDGVMKRIAELFDNVIAASSVNRSEISGASIGLPGSMNTDTGYTTYMTNLPDHWINVPVSDTMQKLTGIPTFILNDARAITWGELSKGAGRGCNTLACYTMGTGIGGGVVVNGRLLMGQTGQAGELGHQIVEPHGNDCNCRGKGCLETYCSGPAIRSAAIKAVCHGSTTILGEMVGYDLNKITPRTVAEAALRGDKIANNIYRQAGFYLGIAIVNAIVTLEPDRVILAGGVAAAGRLLLDPIWELIHERCYVAPMMNFDIVRGELGDDAGIIGNAMWADFKLTGK